MVLGRIEGLVCLICVVSSPILTFAGSCFSVSKAFL